MAGNRAGADMRQSHAKAAVRALMGLGKMPHYNVNLLKSRRFPNFGNLVTDADCAFPTRGRLHRVIHG
tara:strand:- start:253 stop:456 length:204 start_codon:yes stop_codon:yes gene_type:complete